MPKKKKKVMSLEVIETCPKWDYSTTRILNNFICYEDAIEEAVKEMDRREYWKAESDYKNEVKSILAPKGTRGASEVFFSDDVNVEEVILPPTIKSGADYLFKVYSYIDDKVTTEYATQKVAIALITKRIKTKYACVTSNGRRDRIEYSPEAIGTMLDGLKESTSQLEVEPIGRAGVTGNEVVLVSVFKNLL